MFICWRELTVQASLCGRRWRIQRLGDVKRSLKTSVTAAEPVWASIQSANVSASPLIFVLTVWLTSCCHIRFVFSLLSSFSLHAPASVLVTQHLCFCLSSVNTHSLTLPLSSQPVQELLCVCVCVCVCVLHLCESQQWFLTLDLFISE